EPLAPTPPGSLLPAPPEKARPRVACTACWLVDGYGALESSSFLEDTAVWGPSRQYRRVLKRGPSRQYRRVLKRGLLT
ncbi:hypothetical protein AK812_SmicGene44876, partial [Symbiodinium microadriaticum]